MVEWIISNKEWIFSGLGIAIISAFCNIKNKSYRRKTTIKYKNSRYLFK